MAQVTGRAAALSSDTLAINGQIFQLHGVDAIEFHQFCYVDGRPWACGASATRAFQTLIDPVVVTCRPTGAMSGDVAFAVCSSSEGDLADIMVRQGWALAFRPQSEDYVAAEEAARIAGEGVWRGPFVDPWAYREDIAAIERRYAERAMEAVRTAAEQGLTGDGGGIDILRRFVLTERLDAGGATTADREIRIATVETGFIPAAIEARGVFAWEVVARALESWRRSVSTRVVANAADWIWTDLNNLPSVVVDIEDAAGYYAAVSEVAAGWIAAGRQPILLVPSPVIPSWLGAWLTGNPPDGAVITRKDGIAAPPYLGTIDGIDVYVGRAPQAESLLFPDDLLREVAYRLRPDGAILAMEVDLAPQPDELVFRYGRAATWLGDPVVRIRYPEAEIHAAS